MIQATANTAIDQSTDAGAHETFRLSRVGAPADEAIVFHSNREKFRTELCAVFLDIRIKHPDAPISLEICLMAKKGVPTWVSPYGVEASRCLMQPIRWECMSSTFDNYRKHRNSLLPKAPSPRIAPRQPYDFE